MNEGRYVYSGLAKLLAQRLGDIVFSSRPTKMHHCPAWRALLNTRLPRVLKFDITKLNSFKALKSFQ